MFEETDWNDLWKNAVLGASWRKRGKDPVAFFDGKAEWYNKVVLKRTDHAPYALSRIEVDRDATVLDIGSGPGTLAIPLARTVKHVTAVDPSEAMLHYLKKNAQKEGVENIACLNEAWEDVVPGRHIKPHDVVIASYSLAMPDLSEALIKMNRAAHSRVYLFAAAGRQYWDYHDLWPDLYGETYTSGPDYIYIVNVLYQSGIHANVEIQAHESRELISDLEEAVQERLEYFENTVPNAETLIREHLTRKQKENNGTLWAERRTKTAMIWWDKEQIGTKESRKNAAQDIHKTETAFCK